MWQNDAMTRRKAILGSGGALFAVASRAADELQLSRLASVNEFEPFAKTRLIKMAYDYLAGGVGSEVTLRANNLAWERVRIRPRVFVDVSRIDTTVTLFGTEMPHPILLAPTAYHRLFHAAGEIETVKGAAASGSLLVASSFSTTLIEDMARAAPAKMWFQLYVQPDRGFTRALVQRAETAGCTALCLTADFAVRGYRDRDIRNAFTLPAGLDRANLRGLGSTASTKVLPTDGIYNAAQDPSFRWRDLEWLRSNTRVPLLVKGIMTAEDAEEAVKSGVSGIVVSNHGGRSLDSVPATAEVFPAIAERIAGRIPLLVDGGIRRGTDILKALAWGASAVLIGRPYVYALASAGSAGIARAVEILTTELKMAMALTGRPDIASIDRSTIWSGPPYR